MNNSFPFGGKSYQNLWKKIFITLESPVYLLLKKEPFVREVGVPRLWAFNRPKIKPLGEKFLI